jgi:hypothetical protein
LKVKRKSSVRLRKMRLLFLVGLACVIVGATFLLFAALWSPGVPPVDVVFTQSGARVVGGIYFDEITIQNHSGQSVMAVVLIKTLLDGSPRISAPVTVCGQCRVTVKIEEVQPTPDMNPDYYQGAIGSPQFIRVEYAATLLSGFANSALPLGLGALALGIVLLIYRRTSLD